MVNYFKLFILVLLILSKEIHACSFNEKFGSGVTGTFDVGHDNVFLESDNAAIMLLFLNKKAREEMAATNNKKEIIQFNEFYNAVCNGWVKLSCISHVYGSVEYIEVDDGKKKSTMVPSFAGGTLVGYAIKNKTISDSLDCIVDKQDYVVPVLDAFFRVGSLQEVAKILEGNKRSIN